MKRSEMVKAVKEAVYIHSDHGSVLSDEEASQILKYLEREGMMPPKYNKIIKDERDLLGGTTEYLPVNEWEPEI